VYILIDVKSSLITSSSFVCLLKVIPEVLEIPSSFVSTISLCLTLDNQDNLYITGFGSDNIHRISGNRDVNEIVLTKDDGISSPSGITFNKQTNELLVINEDFTSIRIYKVHMT
jgi:hypothetical protein